MEEGTRNKNKHTNKTRKFNSLSKHLWIYVGAIMQILTGFCIHFFAQHSHRFEAAACEKLHHSWKAIHIKFSFKFRFDVLLLLFFSSFHIFPQFFFLIWSNRFFVGQILAGILCAFVFVFIPYLCSCSSKARMKVIKYHHNLMCCTQVSSFYRHFYEFAVLIFNLHRAPTCSLQMLQYDIFHTLKCTWWFSILI